MANQTWNEPLFTSTHPAQPGSAASGSANTRAILLGAGTLVVSPVLRYRDLRLDLADAVNVAVAAQFQTNAFYIQG